MQWIDLQKAGLSALLALVFLLLPLTASALETDRQQPLEVNANSTSGTLGDGVTKLSGNISIRQGSLKINADDAEVEKTDGRVSLLTLRGNPARLEQEIEQQGLVEARAKVIVYQVASGLVTLTGDADVKHPQYEISGELLKYDLNAQHFQGDGNGNGRIRIRLEPEVTAGGDDNPDNGQTSDADESAPPTDVPEAGVDG
jgi:lipopolysaccharide export system protein LptA